MGRRFRVDNLGGGSKREGKKMKKRKIKFWRERRREKNCLCLLEAPRGVIFLSVLLKKEAGAE